jgi:hypothetical protein
MKNFIPNPEYREPILDDLEGHAYSAIVVGSKNFFDILEKHYGETEKIIGVDLVENLINVYFEKK